MNLSGLLPLLRQAPGYQEILDGSIACLPVLDNARAFLTASLYQDLQCPVLLVTATSDRAKRLHEELSAWCSPAAVVLHFPEIHVLPYERLVPEPSIVRQRLRVLVLLKGRSAKSPLVVTTARALSQKTLPPDLLTAESIKSDQCLDLSRLLMQLTFMGYETVDLVEVPGTAGKRGGIVDIFSPDAEYPVRIELFGDEVESIRRFDPATQRSVDRIDETFIVPARETMLRDKGLLERAFEQLDLSSCSGSARDKISEDMAHLLTGRWRDGLEFYAPLMEMGMLIDYFPPESIVVLDDPDGIAAELNDLETQAAELRTGQISRGELPRNFPLPYWTWAEFKEKLGGKSRTISLQKWGGPDDGVGLGFKTPEIYSGQLSRFLDEAAVVLSSGMRVILVSAQADRLGELLRDRDISASSVVKIEEIPPKGLLTLVRGSLSGGWSLGDSVLLTDQELFGISKKRRLVSKRRAPHELFIADLSVGDYVVHIDHGIARFAGVVHMMPEGTEREYLILEYAESDKLYLPADQVDRVSRYIGPGGYLPALSRLNTMEWTRTKQRVKQAASELASELLQIYAAREVSGGVAIAPDTLWQNELEASFPYEETPDQLAAIRDIKRDMESPRPMDRLVCGDVGYGKTEVALRAAFKAVMDGKQVAVLVPTTVLAQQHFNTFSERLAVFPVTVEVLSRFRSPREQQEILRNVAGGSVDICIGTHRLLQKDVAFGDLGLVIIDEEQKFGVAHKERLKQLRSEVDVLTLSATPIPRTLHMSLVGVRDMSTMETPPEARLPIKTYVAEYDEELVREAILREMDRGGQVFYLHNRVQSIAFAAHRLSELVPEARIAVAHGQMPEDELELAMMDLVTGRIDVLVCTTIIESGLDLPSANTLIVDQADKLGLTQLYHLRGRVGRGDVRAYAYFLYERGKRLTDAAEKRLRTIFEATELGSGFRIAMKDLEIRGAGNILGAEQSGNMGAVGFDLYCRLLSDAVDALKSVAESRPAKPVYPQLDLPLDAYIPEDYVTSVDARLALYQRLANIDDLEQIKPMIEELEDRFGKIPTPVQHLLDGVRIKLLGTQAGVGKIFTEGRTIIITMSDTGRRIDDAALLRKFGKNVKAGSTQIRLDTAQLGKFWPRILEQVLWTMAKERGRSTHNPDPPSKT